MNSLRAICLEFHRVRMEFVPPCCPNIPTWLRPVMPEIKSKAPEIPKALREPLETWPLEIDMCWTSAEHDMWWTNVNQNIPKPSIRNRLNMFESGESKGFVGVCQKVRGGWPSGGGIPLSLLCLGPVEGSAQGQTPRSASNAVPGAKKWP